MSANDAKAIRTQLANPLLVARVLGLADGAQRQAGGLLVRCPAHGDRTPSCSLTLGDDRTLRARCFGCDLAGDVFTLVASVERLDVRRDFKRVLARAAELAGVGASTREVAPRRPPAPPAVIARAAVVEAELRACTLAIDEPGAESVRAYVERRGLVDVALGELRALDVGEVNYRLQERLGAGGEPVELEQIGLARRDARGWRLAFKEHELVIPWRAPDGALDTIQRRRLDAREPRYVLPRGRAPRWPYGVERMQLAPRDAPVALVEGALDVLAYRALFPDRVALGLPGVEGWNPRWATLVRGRIVHIALDADDAGERKVKAIGDELYRIGARAVSRERLRSAKDWNDALVARGTR